MQRMYAYSVHNFQVQIFISTYMLSNNQTVINILDLL